MAEVAAAFVTGLALVAVAMIGRTVRNTNRSVHRVERNTQPNGHGPLPEAVGKISDDVGLLAEQLRALVRWQATHQARHEFEDARIAARLDLDAKLLRRVATFLDDAERQ